MHTESKQFRLVVHGGAGTIERSQMTPEREKEYRAGIEAALKAGAEILKAGGGSLDAVQAAVQVLEDNPLFNAGKGAVFTNAGTNELDASIMEGKSLKAGAVTGVKQIRNPIALARLVMDKSPHVMFAGEGAEAFAKQMGVELVDPKYFYTEERWQALQRVKKVEEQQAAGGGKPGEKKLWISDQDIHGTVGAVALDRAGDLAAATSTGGNTNKKVGRIGDSPVIGAGTYADNRTCAVSCTGDGEYFIRVGVAHEISAMMGYGRVSLKEAAQTVLDKVAQLGGTGGLIAVDKSGEIALPFNTSGMYRGSIGPDGKPAVDIYR